MNSSVDAESKGVWETCLQRWVGRGAGLCRLFGDPLILLLMMYKAL